VHYVAIVILILLSACTLASDEPGKQAIGRFSLTEDSLQQWKLPKRLKEISGLALTPDDRLFGIADEQAVVYELDYIRGEITKSFALGRQTPRADFEGIAYLGELFYLVTSNGLVFVAPEGSDGERVDFEVYQTGLGRYCEIEGLAQDVQSGTLLLACKRSHGKDEHEKLVIFAWPLPNGEHSAVREIEIPEDEISKRINKKRIRPSAIVIDPETGNLIGVAGPQRAIFELMPNGELIDAIILPLAKRHRQAEGIEITRDGKLLIADEGGKKKARLSVYGPEQNKTTDQ
jgi:uncharacterized protein YjiK